MSFRFLHNMRYPKTFITGLLILVLLVVTFKIMNTVEQRMIFDPMPGHLQAICGAIAGLKYGQERYFCPEQIYKAIERITITYGHTPQEINIIINNEALKLKSVSSSENGFTAGSIGAGYVDYVSLAFLLFGFKIQGLLYLYLLIFHLSIFIFWITFKRDPIGSFLLIIFLLGYYIVIKALPYLGGWNLGNVINYRFLPVLAILPFIHILMVSMLGQALNRYRFIGVLFQSIILLFIFWIRSSIMWMILLLVFFALVRIFFRLLQSINSSKSMYRGGLTISLNRILGFRLWPIILFLSVFVSLMIGKPFILGPRYNENTATGSHVFWHSLYVGLALHPDIRKNYSTAVYNNTSYGVSRGEMVHGLVCSDKNTPGNATKRRIKEWLCNDSQRRLFETIYAIRHPIEYRPNDQDGYSAAFKWLYDHHISEYYLFNFRPEDRVDYKKTFDWFNHKSEMDKKGQLRMEGDFKWSRYDSVLKDVVKDIVRNHPLAIMQNIFIEKPIRYLVAFSHYVSLNYLPLLFLPILCFHFYMTKKEHSRREIQVLKLLGLIFIFSLIPSLLVYPADYLIADSALILIMIIFITFFALIRVPVHVLEKKILLSNSIEARDGI